MATVVQKFGGTSVADAERIKRVAERVASTAREGNRVCVAVSAMGKTTDELIDLAQEVSSRPHPRELDMLLTAGERISMAVLSMAIAELGFEAMSFTGSQAGILTDQAHGRARIVEVRGRRVSDALEAGKIAIVAGFQGVSATADVTTLGRGGTDTTAVALAAYLRADVCEIYTDVDGVFTADPRIERTARKLDEVSFEEMLELASCGARVLMNRSVEYARNHDVPIHVRSSFHDGEGTWVRKESDLMEKAIISGIAHDVSEAKVTVTDVPDRPGVAAKYFRALADAGINIDMIVQNVAADGLTDISFTLPRTDLDRSTELIDRIATDIGSAGVITDRHIGKVSLVGVGMRSHPGVAARAFEALADADINIEIISTSSIRISCVVREGDVQRAVEVMHQAFRLSDEVVYKEENPSAAAAE
jgi:aspartate kinase